MSLLDQLTSPEAGIAPGRPGGKYPTWRPAKERTHPEAIEGTILEVVRVPRREVKEGQPDADDFIAIETLDKSEAWGVYGSVRDLRDRFSALKEQGLLVPGTKIAIKFFGSRNETAKDGTKYSVHSYAVAAEAAS